MDLQDIKRKHFRINVKDNDAVTLKINHVLYDMIDVDAHGIGIRLTPEDIFFSVDDNLPIELTIEGLVHNLQGKVVHISPAGPKEFLCGIEFTDIDEKTETKLIDYLQSCRKKIFKV